jgi:predicted outer membrane repeat protein
MLIIHGCTFTNNSATTDIGGGAIYSEAEHHNVSIEIDSSVFQGNSAGDQGGAICTFSLGFSTVTMALINCTLVDNSAREGGAIYNFSHGDGDAFSTLQVTNTTFSGNVATFGGAVYNDPSSSSGYATLRNTILQAGSSGGTLFGLTSSRGHNLCSDSGGGFLTEPGDQINTDPKLDSGGLQNNGGPTKTIALQPTSPAINNGDPDAPAQDQRYYLRSGVPDIGAFEFGGSVAPMTVVSRKTHGTGGSTFDINLPLTGTPLGVECRRNTGADISGPNVGRDHEIILTFPTAVTVGGASVTSNDMADMPTATFSVSSNVVTVDLHNIANARRLTINLTNASDGVNTNNVNFPMGVLLGDVTNNTVVSNTDIASIKGQVAASVTSANFRNDVTANGIVSNTDVSTAKAQVGTTLP